LRKLVFLLGFILFSFTASAASQFVGVNGTNFTLNGNPFYFAGTNAYYLFYGNINCSSPQANQGCVIPLLNDSKSLNLSVVRTWGFSNKYYNYGYCFQPSTGVYHEATFAHFDRVIKEASDRGLKLIIPFVNNWDNFGGMCEYVKWCNLTNASICIADEPWPFGLKTAVHDSFYTNNCTKNIYKQYVSYFLNRTNTLTGIKYRDDPTIFAWELANEPRARSDTTGTTLNNWIGEMSAYIKSLDPNHLVTPGGDGGYQNKPSDPSWSWWYHGNEGQDFYANHNWQSVDFATFRYYPEPGKFDDVDPNVWIPEHISDAHNIIGKPVIMEEFGSTTNKTGNFTRFYSLLENNGVNGDTFWMLSDNFFYGNNDGYFILCPEDTSICNIISRHANFMNNKTPSAPLPSPYNLSIVPSGGNVEYRLYYNGHHFLSLINVSEAFSVRPHPGVDPNGWGSSWYMQPFLPGATLKYSRIENITIFIDRILIRAFGNVSYNTNSKYGSWRMNISFTYNNATKEINGNGTYEIALLGQLSAVNADLNIYKIASNYLDDVPLLNGTIGDTGDMLNANVTSSNPVLNFIWNPPLQPAHFPGDQTNNLSIDVSGALNNVDTAAQGYAPIAPAYKPSMKVYLGSKQAGIPMIFGGIFNTAEGQQFWSDNIGITPLILKQSASTNFAFDVKFYSKALPNDGIDLDFDGYNNSVDCNDTNSSIRPGAAEICNGIDDNCNNLTDDGLTLFAFFRDFDSDTYGNATNTILACSKPSGYVNNSLDCNDNNAAVKPGATEICNNVDDNCNNQTDESLIQSCGSGICLGNSTCSTGIWGNCSSSNRDAGICAKCNSTGNIIYDSTQNIDCSNNSISEIATCFYNPDNYNKTYDYYLGFNSVCSAINTCTLPPTGWQNNISHTCDVNQCFAQCDSTHLCNQTICTGLSACYNGTYRNYSNVPNSCLNCTCQNNSCSIFTNLITDIDGDGYDIQCDGDCNDYNASIKPGATEICDNAVDDNCNNLTDLNDPACYACTPGQIGLCPNQIGVCYNSTRTCNASGQWPICNYLSIPTYQLNETLCDSLDNDCDNSTDEGLLNIYYLDFDADNFGNLTSTTLNCTKPSGYVSDNTDCNDRNASINPNATEILNGVDDDCDSLIDEGMSNCTVPFGGMNITNDTIFCPGNYSLNGTIFIRRSSITIDCNGAVLKNNINVSATCIRNLAINSTIKNCRIENYNPYGIYLLDSGYNKIINNTFFNSTFGIHMESSGGASNYNVVSDNNFIIGGVRGWHSSNNVFSNNVFSNLSTDGFSLHDTRNSKFINNTIDNCLEAFRIWWGSYYNEFTNNSVSHCRNAFFFDWISDNNLFVGNKVFNNTYGFDHPYQFTGGITNNTFISNEVTGNSYGFYMGASQNSLIKENYIANNQNGIILINSSNFTIYHNNIINNTIQASSTQNESVNYWNLSNQGNYWSSYDTPAEGCNDTNSDFICDMPYRKIANITDYFPYTKQDGWYDIDKDGDGFRLSEDCDDTNASISPLRDGMEINKTTLVCLGAYYLPNGIRIRMSGKTLDCNGATIIGNKSVNSYGIYTVDSTASNFNTIKNCNVTGFMHGFESWDTFGNSFINNSAYNNSDAGFYMRDTESTTIKNNKLSNNYAGIEFYWYGQNHIIESNVLDGNLYGIYIASGPSSSIIAGNTINDSYIGISIYSNHLDRPNHDNNYTNNTVMNSTYGFYTYVSFNNLFKGNLIKNNSIGMYFDGENNTIYHNNIINNSIQAQSIKNNSWSYNNEGNYWSNYDSPSEGCNDSNNDSICDSPYIISANNIDYYPFTKQNGWIVNFTFNLIRGWNLLSLPILPYNKTLLGVFGYGTYENAFMHNGQRLIELKNNSELNETFGFWIYMKNASNITITGERSYYRFNLSGGWALIGYPNLTSSNITKIYPNASIFAYNNSVWYSYQPNRQSNSLSKLTPGFGYWLKN
jgi:mannan endo-1,4-beta-mannosidase